MLLNGWVATPEERRCWGKISFGYARREKAKPIVRSACRPPFTKCARDGASTALVALVRSTPSATRPYFPVRRPVGLRRLAALDLTALELEPLAFAATIPLDCSIKSVTSVQGRTSKRWSDTHL
jgi:hypothetical protein